MSRNTLLRLAAAAGLLALAGCDQMDPQLRANVWRPTGANAGNIAAMVANPDDLISGHGVVITDTNEPALAVGHIWSDRPKPLRTGSGGGAAAGAGGGASGGGGGGGGGGDSGGSGS